MAVNVTIEDHRSECEPVAFVVPDGCRIIIRRCADGADVLVVPDGDTSLPPKTIVSAGEAHRLATWNILARGDDRSFVLRLQDGHGRDHDFIASAGDLVGIGTASLNMTGYGSAYEAARTRRMIAQAEIAEADARALLRVHPADGYVRADRLSVDFDDKRRVATIAVTILGSKNELKIGVDPSRVPWLIERLAWAMGQAKSDER